jgi:hypothetical protein
MCVELEPGKLQFIFQNRSQGFFIKHKELPGFFLCIFSSLTCLKKPVSTSGIFYGGRYQPACHYFLKSDKFSALLYGGKGPDFRPFSYTEERPNASFDFRRDRAQGWIPQLRRIPRVSTFDVIVTRDFGSSILKHVSFCREIELSSSLAKLTMWGSAGRRLLQLPVATDVCTKWQGSVALVVRYLHSEAPKGGGFSLVLFASPFCHYSSPRRRSVYLEREL